MIIILKASVASFQEHVLYKGVKFEKELRVNLCRLTRRSLFEKHCGVEERRLPDVDLELVCLQNCPQPQSGWIWS